MRFGERRGAPLSPSWVPAPAPRAGCFQMAPAVCLPNLSLTQGLRLLALRPHPTSHDGGARGPRSLRLGQKNLPWRPLGRAGAGLDASGGVPGKGERGGGASPAPLCSNSRGDRGRKSAPSQPQSLREAGSSPLGSGSPRRTFHPDASKLPQRTVRTPGPLGLKLPQPHSPLGSQTTPWPLDSVAGNKKLWRGRSVPPPAGVWTYRRATRRRRERSGVPDVRGRRAARTRRWRRFRRGARSPGARSPRSAAAPTRLRSAFAARLAELSSLRRGGGGRGPDRWARAASAAVRGGDLAAREGGDRGGGGPEEAEGGPDPPGRVLSAQPPRRSATPPPAQGRGGGFPSGKANGKRAPSSPPQRAGLFSSQLLLSNFPNPPQLMAKLLGSGAPLPMAILGSLSP